MTPRNRETANIDQNRRAAMAGTPADNDTVPEGEWVAGRRATAQDDVGQPVADFRDPLDADTARPFAGRARPDGPGGHGHDRHRGHHGHGGHGRHSGHCRHG